MWKPSIGCRVVLHTVSLPRMSTFFTMRAKAQWQLFWAKKQIMMVIPRIHSLDDNCSNVVGFQPLGLTARRRKELCVEEFPHRTMIIVEMQMPVQ